MTVAISKIRKSLVRIALAATCAHPISLFASSLDWVAFDLDTTSKAEDLSYGRDHARRYFDDTVQETVKVTQAIRGALDAKPSEGISEFSDALVSNKAINAVSWINALPKAKVISESSVNSVHRKVTCKLGSEDSKITCNDAKKTVIDMATLKSEPLNQLYTKSIQDGISLQGKSELRSIVKAAAEAPQEIKSGEDVKLIAAHEGLVTVAGGMIEFSAAGRSRKVTLDPSLSVKEWSIFVRSTETLSWDESRNLLTSVKPGTTEVFVVMPGRISIINAKVNGSAPSHSAAGVVVPTKPKKSEPIEVPSSLASLDGLDYAVTHGPIAGNHSGLSSGAPDLVVANEVVQLGPSGVAESAAFSRAKSKVLFSPVTIKVVDDRSNPGVVNYPLSGVRVKIAGTDFSEITNARGEVEVRDVPIGSRLLVEIFDDRGHIMPQVSEVFVSRDGASGKISTPVLIARRFASLDLAARAVGVVQDMQKSSFCGTLANGTNPVSGYTVSLDVSALGPFYFNQLGYADTRMANSGRDGQFCFFNVEPGPATLAIRSNQSESVIATALGMVAGRHQEERLNIADVKYLSATMAAVAAASEQLGSEPARANRHDMVENGDVYAIGSGEVMVPVDDGILTTSSAVLSFKGRVWTVSSSSDFETTVQSIATESSLSRQVLKLPPNGFINDMAYYAHATHSPDLGSVVVEHGHLGGHGGASVKLRLVDSFGRDVGDGWYFSDSPVAKAIFFNVPPGLYAVMVETESGHWISADTALVYSESLSYVKTGSPVERRIPARTQATIE